MINKAIYIINFIKVKLVKLEYIYIYIYIYSNLTIVYV